MNNLEITTDPSFLCTDLTTSLNTSSSVARFLPEEDVSTYPLLSKTPSPPPLHFNHPLRQNTIDLDDASTDQVGDDNQGETSSNSESSGIGMDVQVAGTTTLFNQNVYQHLGKNGEAIQENSEVILHANLNIPITKDAPSFVHWNWPMIRKCTFFCFVASVIAMVAIVVSMIASLPRTCNPRSSWFKGNVFLEIDPFTQATIDADDGGNSLNLRDLASHIDHLATDNIAGIRLNSIFATYSIDKDHPIASIFEINNELGKPQDLHYLAKILNEKSLAVVLDLPIDPLAHQLSQPESITTENISSSIVHTADIMRISRSIDKKSWIMDAIALWVRFGVNGFYLNGLEKFADDPLLLDNVRMWKTFLGPDKVLIVNNAILENVNRSMAEDLFNYIDLVTVELDTMHGAKKVAEQIKYNLDGITSSGAKPFIQWSLKKQEQKLPPENVETSDYELASTLLMLMLPGSPILTYGTQYKEPSLKEQTYGTNFNEAVSAFVLAPSSFNHFRQVTNAIALRNMSPSINQNTIQKGGKTEPNTSTKINKSENVVIVERWYPRRNTFISISNLGDKKVSMDLSDLFYSGEIVIGRAEPERIYFKELSVSPAETIVIKLDK